MAPRIPRQALRSRASRCLPFLSRRTFSAAVGAEQTRFSYAAPVGTTFHHQKIFTSLKETPSLANPNGHNAAVILVTPDLAKQLDDDSFMGEFVKLMSASANIDEFHILGAVVDHVSPTLGTYKPLQGISVLRGHLDDMLPHLWQPLAPKIEEDADKVAALTFQMGVPSITLPLTRTTFHNNRASTLLVSRFDMTQGSPRLVQHAEKHTQHISVSPQSVKSPQSIADMGLWAPLLPLTRARAVTESFGNIVRGIEVDGKSVPASTELEDAVIAAFKHKSASNENATPVGVWAMVAPKSHSVDDSPHPTPVSQDAQETKKSIRSNAQYIEQLYDGGARLYKILSGGGGWGPKKGLLSLDPQLSHFSLSDEEEMQNFVRTMSNSGFAPVGCTIQFFKSTEDMEDDDIPFTPGVVFGVSGDLSPSHEASETHTGFIGQHFGALSNEGIFISGSELVSRDNGDGSRLSVPHSRIYLTEDGASGSVIESIPTSALPDAGVTAMM